MFMKRLNLPYHEGPTVVYAELSNLPIPPLYEYTDRTVSTRGVLFAVYYVSPVDCAMQGGEERVLVVSVAAEAWREALVTCVETV